MTNAKQTFLDRSLDSGDVIRITRKSDEFFISVLLFDLLKAHILCQHLIY